jgi:hypothetical protein
MHPPPFFFRAQCSEGLSCVTTGITNLDTWSIGEGKKGSTGWALWRARVLLSLLVTDSHPRGTWHSASWIPVGLTAPALGLSENKQPFAAPAVDHVHQTAFGCENQPHASAPNFICFLGLLHNLYFALLNAFFPTAARYPVETQWITGWQDKTQH